ncbi:polyphosphate kinase 1 [Bacteroidia bacterium]|nr:polyphosphate kinase 1 [Bacteroidia bacterium]
MQLFPRDLSWLSFNDRVLQEAEDPSVPLLERLKFLGIFSSNQDEFFRVRVATQRRHAILSEALENQKKYKEKNKLLKEIHLKVEEQKLKYDLLFSQLTTELNKNRIFLINEKDLDAKKLALVRNYFKVDVLEQLYPIIINKKRNFPYLKDKSIYLAVKMKKKNSTSVKYGLVEIPQDVPRFFQFKGDGGKTYVMFIDDVIRASMSILFKSLYYNQFNSYTLKITRDSELDLLGDVEFDYLEVIKKSLKERKKGEPVRLIYDREMDEDTFKIITNGIKLKKSALIAGQRYHNNKDLMNFPKIGSRNLVYNREKVVGIKELDRAKSVFKCMREKDFLLHHPYQSFDYVLRYLREAAIDPKVAEINITLYRLAGNSNIVKALKNAVLNGKKVTVIMELQARFDEEANIYWSNQLKENGANVIYGFPDKKVHTKLCLILRKEFGKLVTYAHIGTGNYNEQTAELYSDFAIFTCDESITREAKEVFDIIKSQKLEPAKFKDLLVSPYNSKTQLIKFIKAETKLAKQGKKAAFTLKMNSLNDELVIKAIYEAVKSGVKVNLITRSICCLVHQGEKNLNIISIVDKYLEHARIYWFQNGGDERMVIGSADLMFRNLENRFEILTPIKDIEIRNTLKEFLEQQLHDNQKARKIDAEQVNQYVRNRRAPLRSQVEWRNNLRKIQTKQRK